MAGRCHQLSHRVRTPALLVAAFVAAVGSSSCGEDTQRVSPTGISRFEAEVTFGPGSIEQCEGEPCTKATIVVRNVGERTADTDCTIRLTGVPLSNSVISLLIASDIEPGQSARWNLNMPTRRPNGYSAHCPAFDPGALSNVG